MPEEITITAPLAAPTAPVRDYDTYLNAYLTKYRAIQEAKASGKPAVDSYTAADLPTEAEARRYWEAGRLDMEAQERLFYHAIRREDGALHYPDEKGVQVVILTPDGTKMTLGTVFYLPGQEKAAMVEAKRRGFIE